MTRPPWSSPSRPWGSPSHSSSFRSVCHGLRRWIDPFFSWVSEEPAKSWLHDGSIFSQNAGKGLSWPSTVLLSPPHSSNPSCLVMREEHLPGPRCGAPVDSRPQTAEHSFLTRSETRLSKSRKKSSAWWNTAHLSGWEALKALTSTYASWQQPTLTSWGWSRRVNSNRICWTGFLLRSFFYPLSESGERTSFFWQPILQPGWVLNSVEKRYPNSAMRL